MFLNEPSPIKLADLPEELRQVAINAGYEPSFSEKVFHVIEGCLFFEDPGHGYLLTLPNELEAKYPRFFAEQDVGSTDDAEVNGVTLFPLGEEPSEYEIMCVKHLYPDVEPGDWSDISWA